MSRSLWSLVPATLAMKTDRHIGIQTDRQVDKQQSACINCRVMAYHRQADRQKDRQTTATRQPERCTRRGLTCVNRSLPTLDGQILHEGSGGLLTGGAPPLLLLPALLHLPPLWARGHPACTQSIALLSITPKIMHHCAHGSRL